jgi:hypothetical protein
MEDPIISLILPELRCSKLLSELVFLYYFFLR